MKLIFRLACLLFSSIVISQTTTVPSNNNVVGLEHNTLFNATKRYTVTQEGNTLPLDILFDGSFMASYTPTGISAQNPYVITIENLAQLHTQIGAWIGWSTRYYRAINFKIEGYDQYQSANVWRTLADYSTVDYNSNQFVVKLPVSGEFTKLKFTFYRSDDFTNGRLGLSELFFLHPEATTPFKGLLVSEQESWIKNGTSLNYTTGNVGIGLTNPTKKLEIIGDLKSTKAEFSGKELNNEVFASWDDAVDKSIVFSAGTSLPNFPNRRIFNMLDMSMASPYNVKYVSFNINDRLGKERMSFNSVEGSATEYALYDHQHSEFFKVKDYGDSKGAYFQMGKPNSKMVIGAFSDNPKAVNYKLLVSNGNARVDGDLVVDSKIGIGTDKFIDVLDINKEYKLSVKGRIRAEEVKVYNTWADYVFTKEYRLKPLSEVETFIKENNHLPNVPSAKEVTEKGLELGEMAKIQQEKIEELTLYLIQQNKMIENQNKMIKEQNERIKVLEAKLNSK